MKSVFKNAGACLAPFMRYTAMRKHAHVPLNTTVTLPFEGIPFEFYRQTCGVEI